MRKSTEIGETLVLNGRSFTRIETLKRDFYAETLLIRSDEGLFVYKKSRMGPLRFPPFTCLARFLSRREYRNYERVSGIDGVPPLEGPAGKEGFLHKYVPGTPLDKIEGIPDDFFNELARILQEFHRRKIAYVDLAKEENIIVSPEGKPYLIDFQTAFPVGTSRGMIRRIRGWIFERLKREDLYHLCKHKRFHKPGLLTREEARILEQRSLPNRILSKTVKKLYNLFARHLLRLPRTRRPEERKRKRFAPPGKGE